jgi:catechol O-methyltransferase
MKMKHRIQFLRGSVWRMILNNRKIEVTGQIGDGREAAAAEYVLGTSRAGDVVDVLDALDRFAYDESFLMNVGDRKGKLLEAAVRRANPAVALELGTYCGYGALRIATAAPNAKVFSIELAVANAENARRIWAHAGVADRVTCVVGTIGDGGRTLDSLENDHEFSSGSVDFVFLDHDKELYESDLQKLIDRGWFHPGTRVVADNVKMPGAPRYRAYMEARQGTTWQTVEHKTKLEYGSIIPDLMLESVLLA